MGHSSTQDSAGNRAEQQIHSIQGGPEPQSWNSRGSIRSVLPPQMRETLNPGRLMLLSAASCGGEGAAQDTAPDRCVLQRATLAQRREGERAAEASA